MTVHPRPPAYAKAGFTYCAFMTTALFKHASASASAAA
ncbi:hypothetical protein BN2497_3375 [Janthinobacterium sp. CG23_2]|nr:hypothetical protein BN2497_3375 [Janthinobacterium sp. CG23_2]CUU28085.1 hypothetical protein BN3177_3375 [Janthinobacterium sp. CG23_2]